MELGCQGSDKLVESQVELCEACVVADWLADRLLEKSMHDFGVRSWLRALRGRPIRCTEVVRSEREALPKRVDQADLLATVDQRRALEPHHGWSARRHVAFQHYAASIDDAVDQRQGTYDVQA